MSVREASFRQQRGKRTERFRTKPMSRSTKAKKDWLGRNGVSLLLVIGIVVGFGLLAYPSFSDWWNSFHQSRAIMTYAEDVTSMDSGEYAEQIDAARIYNAQLALSDARWTLSDKDRAEYEKQLDFATDGIMGYIQIDKIGLKLPIYHGTSDSVLQTSVGHLEGTSLPVGCASFDPKTGEVADASEGSHCVLSGHRGLPRAKLFSDLDKLVEGDIFTLTVLDQTLTYQVDQIRIVEPNNLSDLHIEQKRDLCTLVTCTPYGINTHRLLVRGHRVVNAQGDAKVVADALRIEAIYIVPLLAVPLLLAIAAAVLVKASRKSEYRKELEREADRLWLTSR